MLSAIKGDGVFPVARIDISKRGATNGWDGIFTKSGLRGMLDGKDYQSLGKRFSFLTAFIGRYMDYKKSVAMKTVHKCYSDIVADVKGDMKR